MIPEIFLSLMLLIVRLRKITKVHQILPLTVDYACFLVKCINYQNVMCIQIIYFVQKMHFLQDSRKTTLANFLKEKRKCCKNFARFTFKFTNLARRVIFTRIVQKLY